MSTSPLIGPTDADVMLMRLDDRLRALETTAIVPPGIVAYVPNGQSSRLVWTGVSFNTNWADYPGWTPVQYAKEPSGVVRLHGLIRKSTTITLGDVMFTLPTGFRPAGPTAEMFACEGNFGASNYVSYRIDIDTAGQAVVDDFQGNAPSGTDNDVSFSGVSFDSGVPLLSTAAGAVIPDGWLFANGATISSNRYGQLVAKLGTTILPDLRASAPLGTVPIIKI